MINRSRRGKLSSQHSGNDKHRWVISYADFITLLFAFFVVMYSMSVVNVSKYRVLSDSLKETFSSKGGKGNKDNALNLQSAVMPAGSSVIEGGNGVLDGGRSLNMQQINERLKVMTEQLSLQNDIQISGDEERIEINLNANILFSSGNAEPSIAAEAIFEEIADQLKGSDSSVDVEGYTDNQPIKTLRYPSNWQLASARAASIVQLLQGFGVSPNRLSAISYGEFRPVTENDTDAGRSKNRRVVLVLHRESVKRPVLSSRDLQSSEASTLLSTEALTQ